MLTLEVVQDSGSRLLVYMPPEQLEMGQILALVLTFGLLIFMLLYPGFQGRKRLFALIPLLGAAVTAADTYASVASSTKLTFSRTDNRVALTHYRFKSPDPTQQIPLDDIMYAVVQVSHSARGGGGTRLVLITKGDKEIIPFNAAFTDVKGIAEARNAINRFLGVRAES